jgi:uncharacterized protein (DUF2141 family)
MTSVRETTETGDLRVEVRGILARAGSLNVALFDRAEDFNAMPMTPRAGQRLPATGDTVVAVFAGLPAGDYAVSTFHDENDNGQLDKNLLGRPTERFGFSRDASGAMGPPDFEAAKVALGPDGRTIVVNLR